MALVDCPECSKTISDLAPACPHCGRPSEASMANATRRRRLAKRLGVLALLVACAVAFQEVRHAYALGVPTVTPLVYSGSLLTFGAPDNSPHTMTLALFVAGANDGGLGSAACSTTVSVTCVNGQFSIPLSASCMAIVQANQNLQSEITVDNLPLGQINVSAVPYAVEAGTAASVGATNVTGVLQVANGGTGSSTQNFTTPSQVILNQTTVESANFNISGNGVVGGTLGIGVQTPGAALEIAGDIRLDGTGGAWNQGFTAANGWSEYSGRANAVRYFGLTACVDFSLTRSGNVGSGLVATGLPPAANAVFFSAYGYAPGYVGLGMYVDTSGNLDIESAYGTGGTTTYWTQGSVCYQTSSNPY